MVRPLCSQDQTPPTSEAEGTRRPAQLKTQNPPQRDAPARESRKQNTPESNAPIARAPTRVAPLVLARSDAPNVRSPGHTRNGKPQTRPRETYMLENRAKQNTQLCCRHGTKRKKNVFKNFDGGKGAGFTQKDTGANRPRRRQHKRPETNEHDAQNDKR